ncbi:MAG: YajQ family cyclic di-GMP-binding protein [Atopobiaceae bacterium]|jgi:uncharacterized protein YajQ (UPF0234 family)
MAKEFSFDVVSQVDLQEVDNAYQQASKELAQRYDLKGTNSSLSFDRKTSTFCVMAPSEFVAGQVSDILVAKLAKRGVELGALKWQDCVPAGGAQVKREGRLVEGIEQDVAKKIAKDLRAQKLKAKVVVEQDKLRVSSASKDVLQAAISFLKEKDYGQPLQYVNYR